MALQSQMHRAGARVSGGVSRRGRQRRRKRALGFIAIALILAGTIYLIGPFGSDSSDNPTNPGTGPEQANAAIGNNPLNNTNTSNTNIPNTNTPPPNTNTNTNPPPNNPPDPGPAVITLKDDRTTNGNTTNNSSDPGNPGTNPGTTSDTNTPPTTPHSTPPKKEPNAPAINASHSILKGKELLEAGQLLEARKLLNTAYAGNRLNPADQDRARTLMSEISKTLIFSREAVPGDPHTEYYTVKSGDNLTNIAKQYHTHWKFIARLNGPAGKPLNPRYLRPGMRLKVVKGPFHAKVSKSHYRLDAYVGDTYVRSFRVGLGEDNSTPLGQFIVRKNSKLENPKWVNPRTSEVFLPDDPKNPLGEYWIGLKGIDKETELLQAYGIHGTIYPDTIGKQASMGCVRMLHDDIEWVYYMLTEEKSKVTIIP